MSLLLATRTQPGSGCGTILRVVVALGAPAAALQPAWLGVDDFVPPPAAVALDDSGYIPGAPAAAAPVQQAFLADEDMPPVVGDSDSIVPMVVQPSQQIVYLSWGVDADWVPPPAPIVEDDAYLPKPAAPITSFSILASGGQTFTPATAPPDEGEVWMLRPWPSVQPQPPILSDDFVQEYKAFDEAPYLPPVFLQPSPLPLAWVDDVIVSQPTPIVEDEGWLPPGPWKIVVPQLFQDTEERVPPPPPIVEDEGWLPWVRQPSISLSLLVGGDAPNDPAALAPFDDLLLQPLVWPSTRGWVFLADDEITTPPPPIVEDEPYLPLVRQPGIKLSLIVGGDAPNDAVAIGVSPPDEDYRHGLVLPPPEPTVLFGPWSYGVSDDIGSSVTDEYWYTTTAWRSASPSRVWIDDDYPIVPTVALTIDETEWLAPPPQKVVLPQQLGYVDEELTVFGLDDESWLPPLPTPRAWAQLVIVDPEQWPTPPLPLPVEDEFWLAQLLQVQLVKPTTLLALPPWLSEMNEQAAKLKEPKKDHDHKIRLHITREGNTRIWYT